jgi:hypothetical protein
MEAVATRLAAALDAPVEFSRTAPRKPGDEAGIPIHQLSPATDEEVEQIEARRRAAAGGAGGGAGAGSG